MKKCLLMFSCVCSFAFGDVVSDHVLEMHIEVETHFTGDSNVPLDYEFDFEIATDTTVINVTVDCPSGFTFAISEFDEYWEEDYGTVVREWEHEVIASVPNFSQYGDGHYTTTVFYASGATQSTVISFLQEDLSTPIPDIATKPVFNSPLPLQGASFPSSDPITFSWVNSDPNVNGVYLERWPDIPDSDTEDLADFWVGDGTFPADHTDPISFDPGNWYADFCFFNGHNATNSDGIPYDVSKACNTEYSFTVYDTSSAGDHIFMIEAGYGAHYASPTSSVPDEYEFYFEIDTDLTVTNIAVDCPGGHHFNLVDYDEDWEDIDFGIPVRDWEIEIPSSVPHWAMFGDGNYTVTVSTVNGSTHTTVVPFLQSDLSTPLPDMTTKPVLTGPDPLQGETFDAVVPITLAWTNSDPGVMGVFLERWLNVEDSDDEEIADYATRKGTYPADHTHPVFFDPGDWVIGFALFSETEEPNADGIICNTFKYTATEYQFNVTDAFSGLDTDHDGLPDLWEEYFYTNIALYGAESDPDGDTLGNLVEFGLRSNPLAVDSDGDGVGDAVEVYWGSNPNQASSIVHYVDPACSSPQSPYTNWATAATNIQDAIDSAIAQDSNMGAIAVTNGTYHITSQLRAEDLIIRSANGPETTIIDAGGNCRCICLEDSVINGFTLRNGHAKSGAHWNIDNGGGIRGGNITVTNCIISNNRADNVGGGIWGVDCTISDCVISSNSADFGGGFYADGVSRIAESIIQENEAQYGGGLVGGTAQNCLIYENQAAYYGGGVHYGTVLNCVVVENSAGKNGGGLYTSGATNSIIWYNTANSWDNCYYSYDKYHCCSPGLYHGTNGNITNAPLFVDETNGNFRLQSGSPCIDAGDNDYVATATDLEGNLRIIGGVVDMGAYESVTPPWWLRTSVSEISASAPAGTSPSNTIFEIWNAGTSNLTYSLSDNVSWLSLSATTGISSGEHSSIQIEYDISGLVSGTHTGIITISSSEALNTPQYIEVIVEIHSPLNARYVDLNNPTPIAPYSSWATAATNIQDAVDVADDGDTVLVDDGHYLLSAEIAVTNDIMIQSVNGPSATIIDGDGSVRCFNLGDSACIIDSFTIQNGYATEGGGIYCSFYSIAPVVTNCVLAGNTADYGGGSYEGTLNNCTFAGNSASYGGGSFYGTLNNCMLTANSASAGGGSYDGTLNNCTLSGNSASSDGGGSYYSELNNCTLSDNVASNSGGGGFASTLNNCTLTANSADYGGGNYHGTLTNCTLTANSASSDGGGSSGGRLNNCTLSGNTASEDGGGSDEGTLNNCALEGNSAKRGGGSYSSTLINCTLTANSADYGGGNYHGTLTNCIVYYNTAVKSGDNWYGNTPDFSYCCTSPNPGGTGNITSNPMLVSASHISSDSPCVWEGTSAAVSGTDIDGEAWQAIPSMGCDEPRSPITGPLQVSIMPSFTNVVVGHPLSFSSSISGEVASNRWEFGDGSSMSNQVYDASHSWSDSGTYAVIFEAFNDDFPDGVSATQTIHVYSVDETAIYVSSSIGDDSYDGRSWATAKKTLQAGVDAQTQNIPGATVWVTNGVYDAGSAITPGYACSNRVVITNDIALRSINGADVTIIQGSEATGGGNGSDAVRGVYMSAGGLSGFTITNGHTMTPGSNSYDQSGGGVMSLQGSSGIVNNCTLIGNSAVSGGGSCYGTLNNCVLTGNSAYFSGGGSYQGTLNNCTLTGNTANYGSGGGSYGGTLDNCIIYFNTAARTGDNWFSIFGGSWNVENPNISYCCTTPDPGGTGNITNDPVLVSISHISVDSPCVGAGSPTTVSGTDIDGDVWRTTPSIGCDEPRSPRTGSLKVSIISSSTNVVVDHPLSFSASIFCEVASNRWTFGDGASMSNQVYDVWHSWSSTGTYTVVLTAFNDDFPSGVSATQTIRVYSVDETAIYVSDSTGDDAHDGRSWATAKKTLQAGVDVQAQNISGATVWVTNGVYSSGGAVTPNDTYSNRVVIANDIILRSVNGSDVTIIQGSKAISVGNGPVRGVSMSAGILTGFTITNGHALNGGGVNMHGGSGIVSNCTISGNSASCGGGSCYGTLNNCILSDNSVSGGYDSGGGGSYYSTLNNCVLSGNSTDSYIEARGGGSHGGTLNNCTLSGNSASQGGGSFFGTLNNCTLSGNSASYGGGSCYGTLNNCTLSGNSASSTIHYGSGQGGGSYNGTLNNCIIYFNTADWRDNWYDGTFSYCCTTPDPGGIGNITDNPLFIYSDDEDFQLATNSPCIDAGNNADVSMTTDLAGNARISDGTVDMGAYEFISSAGDADADGIPDTWETDYFGAPGNCNPNADSDGDGQSNLDEYISGMDPTNAASRFAMGSVTKIPEGFVVTWNAVEGRIYDVLWTPSLGRGFQLLETGIEYPINSYTDTIHSASSSGYYMVRVRLPGGNDSDGDGLPDAWESDYFSDSVSAIAAYDFDGDGQSNFEEYIAGTNPTNAASLFKVIKVWRAPVGTVIEWGSVTGRVYTVLWSAAPADSYKVLQSGIDYPQNSYTDTVHNAEDSGFYKVDVRLEL